MPRTVIREWKQDLRKGLRDTSDAQARDAAQASALALLQRSITFGHRRLAVQRLVTAVKTGAQVPSTSWIYCREAAQASRDPALQALFVDAALGR